MVARQSSWGHLSTQRVQSLTCTHTHRPEQLEHMYTIQDMQITFSLHRGLGRCQLSGGQESREKQQELRGSNYFKRVASLTQSKDTKRQMALNSSMKM